MALRIGKPPVDSAGTAGGSTSTGGAGAAPRRVGAEGENQGFSRLLKDVLSLRDVVAGGRSTPPTRLSLYDVLPQGGKDSILRVLGDNPDPKVRGLRLFLKP